MKYQIRNRVINADQIVMAEYFPAHESAKMPIKSSCNITLAATEPDTNYNGDTTGAQMSIVIVLTGADADAFWAAYSRDAFVVVNP